MPTDEEWRNMSQAIFGIYGSEKDIGLLRRYDRLETKLDSSWKAMCVFGTIGIALCMAILALLSYLATHREHAGIATAPSTLSQTNDAGIDGR